MEKLTITLRGTNNSIHDLAGNGIDRDITFAKDCKYAVVWASYYGGKGYTTHKTAYAAAMASAKNSDYSHNIIDRDGNIYTAGFGDLEKTGDYVEII